MEKLTENLTYLLAYEAYSNDMLQWGFNDDDTIVSALAYNYTLMWLDDFTKTFWNENELPEWWHESLSEEYFDLIYQSVRTDYLQSIHAKAHDKNQYNNIYREEARKFIDLLKDHMNYYLKQYKEGNND